MKIQALTAQGGYIFFDFHDTVIHMTADGKIYMRPPAGGASIELDPRLMSLSRYRAFLLWLANNSEPELADFTNPDAIIADGRYPIENSGIALLSGQSATTIVSDDPLTQQLATAGYTVQAPK